MFLACVAVFGNASTSGVKWNKTWNASTHQLEDATEAKASDWMADLPDNMFVAHVSIPGAHDFVTGEDNWMTKSLVTGPRNSTCQSATMDELLAGGIRGLDLRPGCFKPVISQNRRLYLCHGIDIMDVTWEAAMDKLAQYLINHTTEFFVIHIYPGNNGSDPTEANDYYNQGLNKYPDCVAEFKPSMTVGEARGKMIFLVRPDADYLTHNKQADIVNWNTSFNDDQRPARITGHSDANLSTRLHVQDIASSGDGTIDLKKAHQLNLCRYFQNQDTPSEMYAVNGYYTPEWAINFCSMQTSFPLSFSEDYKSNSVVLNKNLLDYLEAGNLGHGPTGVVLADYCLNSETNGDRLIYKVIENNFTGGDDAPVVRYSIDPSIDWDQRPENEFAGKRLFLRNVGASEDMQYYKYFGGGANWGAHAVANYAGQYVTFEKGDNGIRIITPWGALQNKDGAYYCDVADGNDFNGTEFVLTRTYWDGYPVYHITGQISNKRLTAIQYEAEGVDNVYYDRPAYFVDPRDPDDTDPHQMWQLIAYAPEDEVPMITIPGHDRISRLKEKANAGRGMDATFLIPSYSFGEGDRRFNWSLENAGNNLTTAREKTANGSMWHAINSNAGGNTFRLSNTVQKYLPAGNYVLNFHYASTSDGANLNIDGEQKMALTRNSDNIPGVVAGQNDTSVVGDYFNTHFEDPVVYATVEFTKTTDENTPMTFSFERADNTSSVESFYLDNIRLTYYGTDDVQPTEITLDFPNVWNTMILPFEVSESNMPEGFENMEVYEAVRLSESRHFEDYDYQVVYYDGNKRTTVEANYPYLVRNPLVAAARLGAPADRQRVGASDYTFTFMGFPTNRKNDYHDNAGILTGLTETRGLQSGDKVYLLNNENPFQYFNQHTDSEVIVNVGGRRAYLNGRTAPGVSASRVYFEEFDSVITGIDSIEMTEDEPVDVYSMTGILIYRNMPLNQAMRGLGKGIYIINAQKGAFKVVL